jgi:O-antigen ligase
MSILSVANNDRTKLAAAADVLVIAVAAVLPWSTSATGILLVLWLFALVPSISWTDLRRELVTPAAGLPVLLMFLGLVGMAWADVSLVERWKGLDGFVKLLAIPFLMVQFRRSDAAMRVFVSFLTACVVLLVASWVVAVWPNLPKGSTDFAVTVKSYIVQSIEFTICAAAMLYLAVAAARDRRWPLFVGLLVLALGFLHNVLFLAISRTTLVVIPALVLVYGMRWYGRRGLAGALLAVVIVGLAAAVISPTLRDRVSEILTATDRHSYLGDVTSSEERLIFWKKSIRFIAEAPVVGHGTGTIEQLFAHSAVGQTGVRSLASANPHNQSFAVGIQLGLMGVFVLWAMWASHVLVFRGNSLTMWIGLVIVTQNIVGSLFNSFLFDFTEGWLYVIGFGVAAGAALREFDNRAAKLTGAPAARNT